MKQWKVNDGCVVRFSRNARPCQVFEAGAVFEADKHEITGLESCLTELKDPSPALPVNGAGEEEKEVLTAERAPETFENAPHMPKKSRKK